MIIANNASDLYGALIVVGIMAHLSIQMCIRDSYSRVPGTFIFDGKAGVSYGVLFGILWTESTEPP